LVEVVGVAEEGPGQRDRVAAAERPGRGDGAVLLPRPAVLGQVLEGAPGRLRRRILVDGDEALLVLVRIQLPAGMS
jgi:hypothetical protein